MTRSPTCTRFDHRPDLDDGADAAVSGNRGLRHVRGPERHGRRRVADLRGFGADDDLARSDRQELEILQGRAGAEPHERAKPLAGAARCRRADRVCPAARAPARRVARRRRWRRPPFLSMRRREAVLAEARPRFLRCCDGSG